MAFRRQTHQLFLVDHEDGRVGFEVDASGALDGLECRIRQSDRGEAAAGGVGVSLSTARDKAAQDER